jgi:signal peptidase complex subunit 3
MHSTLVRGQNVFGFFTTVVSFVAGFIALSVLVQPPTPTATLAMRNVQMYVSRLLSAVPFSLLRQ